MRHLTVTLVVAWSLVCVWSGAWAWQININGTANRFEQATAVAVDGAGDVVASGWTDNRGTFNDFTVVKWAGDTGAELWRVVIAGTQNLRDDLATAVAVDGAGDVVASGWTSTTDTGLDFTVVKLSGSSGAELWRAVIASPGRGDDQAYAVTVDAAGDVVAAGLTENSDTGAWDFTVVKFEGAAGPSAGAISSTPPMTLIWPLPSRWMPRGMWWPRARPRLQAPARISPWSRWRGATGRSCGAMF